MAAAAAAYAVLEGVEAVGLWYQKRWAEYLTFIAGPLRVIPYEVYDCVPRPVAVSSSVAFIPEHRDDALPAAGASDSSGCVEAGAVDRLERAYDTGWGGAVERTAPWLSASG